MPTFHSFGRYLPETVIDNNQLSRILNCDADWIFEATGIEERCIAAPGETVVDLGVHAARNCLERTGSAPRIGMIVMASGSSDLRFPGPAAETGQRLGLAGIPAIDLPIASAGSLFGMVIAAHLAPQYGTVLLIAAEKMFTLASAPPVEKNVAVIFGDGAGACLIDPGFDGLVMLDSAIHSDGSSTDALKLGFSGRLAMNGLAVIRHATQKLPQVIQEVLHRNEVPASGVKAWLMHQANQNLIDRVARAVGAPSERFFSNISRYGNTSSASMLIAASEWSEQAQLKTGDHLCFAAFGAGFHWGSLLARQS
jgi:3-oxoacyl-[acyl-carrier-protein] synthase III